MQKKLLHRTSNVVIEQRGKAMLIGLKKYLFSRSWTVVTVWTTIKKFIFSPRCGLWGFTCRLLNAIYKILYVPCNFFVKAVYIGHFNKQF